MVSNFMRNILAFVILLAMVPLAMAEDALDFWQGFHLGGYTSVDLHVPRTETTNLKLNEISLILTWEQNSRFKFFSELELEDPIAYDGKHGVHTKSSNLDLERLYLDYNVNEKANIRVGRFLTPAGRWNQLHASPLVWTASRPLATLRLFPSGINGAMLFGTVPVRDVGLEYQLYAEAFKDQYQDGSEIIYRDVRGGRLALNNLLGFSGDNPGLNTLGLNFMSYRKDQPGAPMCRLFGLDFLLEFNRWELSGEAYVRNTVHGADAGSGAYLQSAYLIDNNWYWITRLENLHEVDDKNAERWVLGLTKRVKPNQLLKFEFIGGSGEYEDVPRGFATSFAVMF